MRDLSVFGDECFDLVFHPVSNVFCPEVLPVWREAFRVLRMGGELLAGFDNPCIHMFDTPQAEKGIFELKYPLPFDSTRLSAEDRHRIFGDESPLEFSHTFEQLIGGQMEAGFVLLGMYEDQQHTPLGKYMPGFFATRAIKPRSTYNNETYLT